MMMLAVKQPLAAVDNNHLQGTFYSGVFMNNAAGTVSDTVVNKSLLDGTAPGGTISTTVLFPAAGALPDQGYEVDANGVTVIDDTPGVVVGTPTGVVGMASAAGDLFIAVDTDQYPLAPEDDHILGVMSIKTDGTKTDASLNGTYVLHQLMDDQIGDGSLGFQTNRYQATFNGDGTGTYSHLATSSAGGLEPAGNLTYIVDDDPLNNPDTFLLNGVDYGVISIDTNVIGIVTVNEGGEVSP